MIVVVASERMNPIVSSAQIDAVLARFAVRGRVLPLRSERDENFLVVSDSGCSHVVKISSPEESADVTDFQTAALLHCERVAPKLPLPRIVRMPEGTDHVVITDQLGRPRVARVLTYLEGSLWHKIEPTVRLRSELGRMLAALGLALRSFEHRAERRELLWDLQHSAALLELLPHVPDAELRARVRLALEMHAALKTRPEELRSQVVHNDFNPHNILVGSGSVSIVGVIDFGDLVHTALVNDVAVAASYQFTGADPVGNVVAFVTGYQEIVPLGEIEIDLLGTLIATRMAMTIAISCWRAHINPENAAYITRNRPAAAIGLGILQDGGLKTLRDRLSAELR